MSSNHNLPEERSIHEVIQQIKDGSFNPRTLDKETRQLCIEIFLAEGYTMSTMAQILAKCEKTIQRDLVEIRAKNAVNPDVDLAKEIIGELLTYARIHRAYLMRLARTKDATVSEKAQAEYFAARVGLDLVSKMQTLGYLPLKPNTIIGDVFHHFNNVDTKGAISEISNQADDLEKLLSSMGPLPEAIKKEFIEVKGFLKKAEDIQEDGNHEED